MSGSSELTLAMEQRIADDFAAYQSVPGWTGDAYASLAASGNAPAGGTQSFELSGYYYYALATDYVFVPVIHWDAPTFQQWIWPDPTFHGVFPGLGSTQEMTETFGISEWSWSPDLVLDWTGSGFHAQGRVSAPRIAPLRSPRAATLADAPRQPWSARRTR